MNKRWGVGVFCILLAVSASAQTADWTRVASNLDQLNAQILDWAGEFPKAVSEDASAVVALHLKRGPVVATGLANLFEKWLAVSETQKKSRYLAITRYFATHCDDWGTTATWAWYRCFSPPLDARYNMLAAYGGQPTVELAVPVTVPHDQERALLDATLPDIIAFLSAYAYPIVDTPLTRLGFDNRGILVDGQSPRDRQLLNNKFTYRGTLIELFGAGI